MKNAICEAEGKSDRAQSRKGGARRRLGWGEKVKG